MKPTQTTAEIIRHDQQELLHMTTDTQTTTHTPGPWIHKTYPGGDIGVYPERDGYDVTIVRASTEAEANAALIASAPDLLAALEAADDLLTHSDIGYYIRQTLGEAALYSRTTKAVTAAIAQARGEG